MCGVIIQKGGLLRFRTGNQWEILWRFGVSMGILNGQFLCKLLIN